MRCKILSHKSLLQFYGVVGLLRHPDRGVMMLIGYARVSTQDQTLRLQHDALTAGGCEKLFREKLSGTRTTLPERETPRVRAQGRCRRGVETRSPWALPPRSD